MPCITLHDVPRSPSLERNLREYAWHKEEIAYEINRLRTVLRADTDASERVIAEAQLADYLDMLTDCEVVR